MLKQKGTKSFFVVVVKNNNNKRVNDGSINSENEFGIRRMKVACVSSNTQGIYIVNQFKENTKKSVRHSSSNRNHRQITDFAFAN